MIHPFVSSKDVFRCPFCLYNTVIWQRNSCNHLAVLHVMQACRINSVSIQQYIGNLKCSGFSCSWCTWRLISGIGSSKCSREKASPESGSTGVCFRQPQHVSLARWGSEFIMCKRRVWLFCSSVSLPNCSPWSESFVTPCYCYKKKATATSSVLFYFTCSFIFWRQKAVLPQREAAVSNGSSQRSNTSPGADLMW